MIRPKKSLGQHFLRDPEIARQIVDYFILNKPTQNVLEIGPGTGALTADLLQHKQIYYQAVEIDGRAVQFLVEKFPELRSKIFHEDFLFFDLRMLGSPVSLIGNFPYNISSQILFHTLKYRDVVPFIIGMFQREVAQRIASIHGNRTYGILSIFMQAFYDVQVLFDVKEESFHPKPKVKSSVVSFKIKPPPSLLDEPLFFDIVKTAFSHRRKTLRNSLQTYASIEFPAVKNFSSLRAEQVSVEQWIEFANIAAARKKV
jgi:16S rRNA (adenine1518-N6/adenine1519-N6)-dimethyltransferase